MRAVPVANLADSGTNSELPGLIVNRSFAERVEKRPAIIGNRDKSLAFFHAFWCPNLFPASLESSNGCDFY